MVVLGWVKIREKGKGIEYVVEWCEVVGEKEGEVKREVGVVVLGKEWEEVGKLVGLKV